MLVLYFHVYVFTQLHICSSSQFFLTQQAHYFLKVVAFQPCYERSTK